MADGNIDSLQHEHRVSSVECVRDDQKSTLGLKQSSQKLKDLLLSAATNTETAIALGNLDIDRPKNNVILQSSFDTCNAFSTSAGNSCAGSSVCGGQFSEDNKGTLDYHNSEDIHHGFDKFGLTASSSPWCSYSDRRNDCIKQTSISRILSGVDKNLANESSHNHCEQEESESFFEDSALDPLGSKFDNEEEWEMGSSALDNGSPLKEDELDKAYFTPHHLDSKAMVFSHKTPQCRVALSCLLIGQENAAAHSTFADDILQTVGESQVVECRLDEALRKSVERKYGLICLQLSSPILHDELCLMESLRAANKSNKDSYIVAVAQKQINVDLRAKGADEVMVEPVSKDIIKRTCMRLSSLTTNANAIASTIANTNTGTSLGDVNGRANDSSVMELSRTRTPESSISTSTKRTDLDIDSSSPSRSSTLSSPRWCRMEHATKEKQRRERIKDSCDQLRVLLPYVKGRKTDMASILEMTVDYLKIVSSALPENFHSEVIDIMSTGSPPFEGQGHMAHAQQNMSGMSMAVAKKNSKRGTMASARSNVETVTFCQGEVNANRRMTTRALSRANGGLDSRGLFPAGLAQSVHAAPSASSGILVKRSEGTDKNPTSIPAKREYPENEKTIGTTAKRAHVMTRPTSSSDTLASFFPVVPSAVDAKRDSVFEELSPNTTSYHGLQFPQHFLGTDVINAKRNFSTGPAAMNDNLFAYSSSMNPQQQQTPSSRMMSTERTDLSSYGSLYFDSAYYHHYPYASLQDSNNGNYFLPPGTNEYVNPNAVLPVTTYAPRVTSSNNRKLDRLSSTTALSRLAIDNSDTYNNNSNSNSTNSNNTNLNTNNTFLNPTTSI